MQRALNLRVINGVQQIIASQGEEKGAALTEAQSIAVTSSKDKLNHRIATTMIIKSIPKKIDSKL